MRYQQSLSRRRPDWSRIELYLQAFLRVLDTDIPPKPLLQRCRGFGGVGFQLLPLLQEFGLLTLPGESVLRERDGGLWCRGWRTREGWKR